MSPVEQFVAFMTILVKEIRRYTRIWTQTLLPSAITMSLYFVIFGSLIGSRIGEMGGFSYMEFVVPGLIMMAISAVDIALWDLAGKSTGLSISELLGGRVREKVAAGISGLIALTSSSPVALNTSTTPRLYSLCFSATKASICSRALRLLPPTMPGAKKK